MKNYFAFIHKELLESLRTYKLLIMLIVFFVFGLISPLTAKLMPDLLSSFMPAGMTLTLNPPTAIDAWSQFFKNTSQMGLILTLILFSGIISTERSKGTLINMLTKGLSRNTVIFSKFTAAAIIWTLSYGLSFLVSLGYTVYLFPQDKPENLLFSVFCLWLFGLFLLSLLILAGAMIRSTYGSLLLTGAAVVLLMAANLIPDFQKYNPFSLAAQNVPLLTGSVKTVELFPAAPITLLCTIIFIAGAAAAFSRAEL